MPTLDDAPIQPVLSTLALTDRVQIFDVSERQGSKVITVGELLEQAVALLPTSSPPAVGDLWVNAGVLTRRTV